MSSDSGLMKKIALDMNSAAISEQELRTRISVMANKTFIERLETWFINLFISCAVGFTGLGLFYLLIRCGMSLKGCKLSGFRFTKKGKSKHLLELEILELREKLHSLTVILDSIQRKTKVADERLAKVEMSVTDKADEEMALAQEVESMSDDWLILNQMKMIFGGLYRQVGIDQEKLAAYRTLCHRTFFLDEAIHGWDQL